MTCTVDADVLSAFCDGELPAHEYARVAGHLETCAPCGATLARYRRLSDHLGAVRSVRAPDSLRERVLSAATERVPISPRVAAAMAGALLYLGAAFSVSRWAAPGESPAPALAVLIETAPEASRGALTERLRGALPYLRSGRLAVPGDDELEEPPELRLLARLLRPEEGRR